MVGAGLECPPLKQEVWNVLSVHFVFYTHFIVLNDPQERMTQPWKPLNIRCIYTDIYGSGQRKGMCVSTLVLHFILQGRDPIMQEVVNAKWLPYRLYITAQKYRFLPCGVTARTKNIYLFWGCGIEKRGFLAYFGAKIPVRGWCKLNISRVRG